MSSASGYTRSNDTYSPVTVHQGRRPIFIGRPNQDAIHLDSDKQIKALTVTHFLDRQLVSLNNPALYRTAILLPHLSRRHLDLSSNLEEQE